MGLASENEREIEQTFRGVHEAGISLLSPPSSTEELLKLLDKSEKLMAKMEQSSSEATKDALFPIMRALKSPELFRSSDMDVKMSVLSCISKMIRITAPDAPYNDSVLKVYFHMLVPAFASLSEVSSSRSYGKVASILEIAADVKFCLLMLDLKLDKLVIEMLQLFLKTIRSDHPNTVFNHMETVMTMIVDESEYISFELLSSLLANVRRENQNFSPVSRKLGERVLKNCAAKLQPYIKKAVDSSVISLDDYFQIITSICESGRISEEDRVGSSGKIDVIKKSSLSDGCTNEIGRAVERAMMRNGNSSIRNDDNPLNEKSSKTLEPFFLSKITKSADANDISEVGEDAVKAKKPEISTDTAPKKRNWKPNTKTLPDEGYSHYWDSTEKRTRSRKPHEKGIDRSHSSRKVASPSTEDQVIELLGCSLKVSETTGASSFSQNGSVPEGSYRRRGRPKKNQITLNEDGDCIPSVSKVDFLKPRVKEEILDLVDVSLEKEPDNTSCPRKRKRKRTPAKAEASVIADVDNQLIGKKIKVWWPLDKKFYFGVVRSYDHEERKHKVLYTDGEEETLNLKEELWEVIGDGEQEADPPKHDASSSTPLKRKRNRKSSWSAENMRTGPSSKRGKPRSKRIEVDDKPGKNPVIDERVNGQNSKPATPETVIVSKVESSIADHMGASPQHCSKSGGAKVHCSGN